MINYQTTRSETEIHQLKEALWAIVSACQQWALWAIVSSGSGLFGSLYVMHMHSKTVLAVCSVGHRLYQQ